MKRIISFALILCGIVSASAQQQSYSLEQILEAARRNNVEMWMLLVKHARKHLQSTSLT